MTVSYLFFPMCSLRIMSYLAHLQLQEDFGISSAVQTICSYHVSLSGEEYGKQIALIIKQPSISNSVDMTCFEGGCISSIDLISSIRGVDQSIRLKVLSLSFSSISLYVLTDIKSLMNSIFFPAPFVSPFNIACYLNSLKLVAERQAVR